MLKWTRFQKMSAIFIAQYPLHKALDEIRPFVQDMVTRLLMHEVAKQGILNVTQLVLNLTLQNSGGPSLLSSTPL